MAFVPDKAEERSEKNNEKSSALDGIIITDGVQSSAPDFDKYSQAISNIIANSVPRFTVGI